MQKSAALCACAEGVGRDGHEAQRSACATRLTILWNITARRLLQALQ